MSFRFLGSLVLLIGAAFWLSRAPEPETRAARRPKLPIYFIENQGQVDPQVAYYVQGRHTAAYFTPAAVFYSLTQAKPFREASLTPSPQAWVRLEFLGANPQPVIEPLHRTEAIVSYFRGQREQWKTGLPTYSGVLYHDLWPGIDLEFAGPEGALKYTFHVRPGADPRKIGLAYRGATGVTLTPSGSLHIETPAGDFGDDKPVAWQDNSTGRQPISAAFRLEGEQVRFQLGAYDSALPLTIDPVVLLYAGFVGGSGFDYSDRIAVDAAGNAYVTGDTESTQTTFPVTVGPDLTYNGSNGFNDAFVAKVNAAGTALVYAGFLGGSGDDYGRGIAVDAAGNAYVTGYTFSTQATFPVTTGPDLTHNGDYDAFVAKVNTAGTALVYAGFLGGSGDDRGSGIAVDAAGNAYVTGDTESTQATFPVTVGPDLTYNGSSGFNDAFVAKVNAAGTALVYAGFLGGYFDDSGRGIAVDAAGNAYITGGTTSTQATFPVTTGPDLTHNGGGWDAFVAKVNAAGTALVYSGFLGGSGADFGFAIAVDAAGNAYVTGGTDSSQATFPVTAGPDLTHNGDRDAFVAKVNAAGTALVYAGFLGGSGYDFGNGIAVDAAGNAYVTGRTHSTEATFPVTVGPDLTYNDGIADAFVAKVRAFPGTAGPVLALRNAFNAIETNTFPSSVLRNSGGNFRLNPALALSPSGRAFVAGRDAAAGVWINVLNPDETYQGWQFAGGNSPGQPALVVAGETAWIAVRDPWSSYSVRPYDPTTGFGSWTWLQGVLATDPQIAACPNGDVYVSGRDNWNGVWTRRYSASLAAWQAWRFVGGIITGAPVITCGSDNAAYVAVRDTSNNMWLARVFQEVEVAWNYGAGIFQGDLQVAANGNLIHVVGLSSGAPWYRTWLVGSGWQGWTSPGGVLAHFAPAIYGGQVFLAGQDASGNLWWWTSLGNSWTHFGNKNIAVGSRFSGGAR